MKVLLVPFAVFNLIAHGASAFSLGCSIHRATSGNKSSIEQQRWQSAKKQKPIHVWRSATCVLARPKLTDEEYDERKEKLRQLLCVNQKDIDKLVDGNPLSLNLDIDGNIVPKLEMLQRKLGIDQKRAGRMLCNPSSYRLIGLKQETIEAKIDYLQTMLGLSKKEMAKILLAYPSFLRRSIKYHYEPLFNALQTSFGFTQDEIAKLVIRSPQFLYRVSEKNIEPIASSLPQILGLDEKDQEGMKKCIHRMPSILNISESQIRKSYEWIRSLLGDGQSAAGRICRNRPQLLCLGIEHLQNKVDWYQERLSLTDEEFRKVVANYPTILIISVEDGKMDKKISHLQKIFGINDKAFKEMFLRRPESAALSAERNIEPKMELYGSLLGTERARKLIVESPNLLLESMDKRIKPRLEEIKNAYEYVEWTETLLKRLVVRTPKVWCDYMLDDAPKGPGEKLDDSGKYKRREK